MADTKDRIMKLLRDGVITQDEAVELLEKSGETWSETDKVNMKFMDKHDGAYTDEDGYRTRTNDAADAFKSAAESFARGARSLWGNFRQTVDDNVDFESGFPKMKKTDVKFAEDFEGDIKEVTIELASLDLTLQKGEKTHVEGKFTIYGGFEGKKQDFIDANTKVALEDGRLEISSERKRIGAELTVVLPEVNYETIVVNVLNGKLNLQDLQSEQLSLNLLHGEMSLKGIRAADVKLEHKNGNVSLTDSQVGKLTANSVNGNLRLVASIEETTIDHVNGNILLTLTDEKAKKMSVQNVHGDVKLAVPENLGLTGHVRTYFGGYKTKLKDLTDDFEPGKNGGVLVRQGVETLTFELETKTGTIWLKDTEKND